MDNFQENVWITRERDWASYMNYWYVDSYYDWQEKNTDDSNIGENIMNVVFIIPTGIGAEIGGHAGDATPAAKLVASVCDKIIVHPNVVNASNFNEMTDNMLYVEGSILDDFLEGNINLELVKSNRILLVANPPILSDLVNTISVAKTVMGIEIDLIELKYHLLMEGYIENNIATGIYSGVDELIDQVKKYEFDALAVATEIKVGNGTALEYFRTGGVNPWGGIEALVSRKIAKVLQKPVAHAPIESQDVMNNNELLFLPYNEVVDPRMAAEAISTSYTYCLFRGLLKAPRPCEATSGDLNWKDVDCLVSPYGCVGLPHKICVEKNIPIIVVEENKTVLNDGIPENSIVVKSYIEAVGHIVAMKEGISVESVRRPVKPVTALKEKT